MQTKIYEAGGGGCGGVGWDCGGGMRQGVVQCNGCRVLAFVPQLERRESGTTGEEDGAAAASDFRIEDEMRLNFTL